MSLLIKSFKPSTPVTDLAVNPLTTVAIALFVVFNVWSLIASAIKLVTS